MLQFLEAGLVAAETMTGEVCKLYPSDFANYITPALLMGGRHDHFLTPDHHLHIGSPAQKPTRLRTRAIPPIGKSLRSAIVSLAHSSKTTVGVSRDKSASEQQTRCSRNGQRQNALFSQGGKSDHLERHVRRILFAPLSRRFSLSKVPTGSRSRRGSTGGFLSRCTLAANALPAVR